MLKYEQLPSSKQVRKIKQLDNEVVFIRIWESAKEVQRQLGIQSSNIYFCCKNKTKTAGGYKWEKLN